MSKRDYYDVLGLSKKTTKDEIKNAYKKLARKYHPDVSKEDNAEEKFKEVSEAYSILGDDDKKRQYDTYGHESFSDGSTSGSQSFDFANMGGFNDVFSSFFGGGRRQNSANWAVKGDDYQRVVEINFVDSVLGTSKDLKLEKWSKCSSCDGTGAYSQTDISNCLVCLGSGQETKNVSSFFGSTTIQTTCNSCSGVGKQIDKYCNNCSGEKVIGETKEISVKIPEGIQNGQSIVLSGYGGAGKNGGPSGNLYLLIKVKSHKYYSREQRNIHLDVPTSITSVLFEKEIEIPTPHGIEIIKLPKHISSGHIEKIKGKGILRGDMILHIQLYIPKFSSKDFKNIKESVWKDKDKTYSNWFKSFH